MYFALDSGVNSRLIVVHPFIRTKINGTSGNNKPGHASILASHYCYLQHHVGFCAREILEMLSTPLHDASQRVLGDGHGQSGFFRQEYVNVF